MAESDSDDRTPRRTSDAFECPRCGVYAHQQWHELKRECVNEHGGYWNENAEDTSVVVHGRVLEGISRNVFDQPTDVPPRTEPAVFDSGAWAMSECQRCREHSTWRSDRLMYPPDSSSAPRAHTDMPNDAMELYLEAGEVFAISRRAGAALARATLERLLRTLDPLEGKQDLAVRIDHILPQVSSSLGEMLTVIRHTGNKSLHVEDKPDDVMVLILDPEHEEIVELIFTAINNLVDELITRPARARDVFDRVPERIRSQVGKKT
jgi:predicted RNA-binding Zn-ribbon protein involved in translation (DUF1610 family)